MYHQAPLNATAHEPDAASLSWSRVLNFCPTWADSESPLNNIQLTNLHFPLCRRQYRLTHCACAGHVIWLYGVKNTNGGTEKVLSAYKIRKSLKRGKLCRFVAK